MQISLQTTVSENFSTLIIPVLQSENLSDTLASLARKYNLSPDRLQADFKAALKEIHNLYVGSQRIGLIGLGKNPGQREYIQAFRSFFYKEKTRLTAITGIDLLNTDLNFTENIVNGILLGQYDIQLYKTDVKPENFFQQENSILELYVPQIANAEKSIAIAKATTETQIRIMDLINAPANKKIPRTLADFAIDSGKKYGFEVKVFDKDQLIQLGFQALLAVGQGSHNPPYFIIMEYKSPETGPKKIGLVGKGITFDTGGISIKDSANMHMMKSDMSGAGAVLGTIELAARLQLPVHLIGVVPTAENSVDATSVKPGDVIGSYLGKTIEVIDTDAEGRLILADALAYINKNYQPDVLIDLATLTGSVIGTLGYAAAGLFTNNDILANALLKTGETTGEKLWRLPLSDDYKDELNSDVADVKNYHGKPIAGAIVAAKFLEVFTENHPAFAHLDIAGTAFADSEFSMMKSATAYGIRLLTNWLRNS